MTEKHSKHSFDTLCLGAPPSFMLDEDIIPAGSVCLAMVPVVEHAEPLRAYLSSDLKVVDSLVSCLGRDTFYEFNVPEYNGVFQPGGVKAFYPGFALLQQYELASKDLAEALALMKSTKKRKHLLICMPNVAFQIVADLLSGGKIDTFPRIQLVAAEHGVYDDVSSDFDARDLLIENGYSIAAMRQVEAGLIYYDFCLSPLKKLLEEANRKLNAEAAINDDLRSQLKKQSQRLGEVESEKTKALDASEVCRNKCSALERDLARINAQFSDVRTLQQESEKNYQKEVGQYKKESERLIGSNSKLKEQLATEQKYLTENNAKRQLLLDEIASLKSSISSKDSDLLAVKERLEVISSQYEESSVNNKSLRSELEKSKSNQAALDSELKGLVHELNSIRDAKKDSEEELRGQLKTCNANRESAERSRDEISQLLDEIKSERSSLQEEKDKLKSESVAIASQFDQLQADADRFKKQASNRAKRIQELEEIVAKLEQDHHDVNHKNQLMHQELVKAEAQIDMIKDFVLRD